MLRLFAQTRFTALFSQQREAMADEVFVIVVRPRHDQVAPVEIIIAPAGGSARAGEAADWAGLYFREQSLSKQKERTH